MPPLHNWNPRNAILKWLNDKKSSTTHKFVRKKATNASHYKGILQAASSTESKTELVDATFIKSIKNIRF